MNTQETALQLGNEVTTGALEQWKVSELSTPLTARAVLSNPTIGLDDPRLAHIEHDEETRTTFERNRLMLQPTLAATIDHERSIAAAVETARQVVYLPLHEARQAGNGNASANLEDAVRNREVFRLMGPGIAMVEMFAIRPDGTIDEQKIQRLSVAILDNPNPLGDTKELEIIRNPSREDRANTPSGYSAQDVGLFGQIAIETRRMAIGSPHGDQPVGMSVLPHLAHGTIATDETGARALGNSFGTDAVSSLHLLHAQDNYVGSLGNSYFDATFARVHIDLNNGIIVRQSVTGETQRMDGYGMRLLLTPKTVDGIALAAGKLEPVQPSTLMGVEMQSAVMTHAAIRELVIAEQPVTASALESVQDRTNEEIQAAFDSGKLVE